LTPLPPDTTTRPVQFARVVVQPSDGEAWAIAYTSIFLRAEGDNTPAYNFLTWQQGRVDAEKASFARVFDEELKKAGFQSEVGESLFGDEGGSADFKVGVLIDDIKGRFCVDCPNLINRNGIPATVVMRARWEIYSSLERKVVARITTEGGANTQAKLQGSVLPAVFNGFRENVRQLLASEDFRRVVMSPAGASLTTAGTGLTPITLIGPKARGTVAQASRSVAVVFAADGSGSGFLISEQGYLLTNAHVVGGSKYVKLKWSDGAETLGEVVRTDRRRDVALIKTDGGGRPPLTLRLGSVRQGEAVYAIGTPLSEKLQNTMTKGIVSASRVDDGQPFIQSDVGVTHGNSGGPLLDESGAVIGLTVMGLYPEESKSLNLFIPIDDALRALALKSAP
jgi:S1-C subfamily serine protease